MNGTAGWLPWVCPEIEPRLHTVGHLRYKNTTKIIQVQGYGSVVYVSSINEAEAEAKNAVGKSIITTKQACTQ